MFGMKRREFMALLGGAAVAWPLAAPTVAVGQQNERMRHLGVLMGIAENDQQTGPFLRKFKRALQELGVGSRAAISKPITASAPAISTAFRSLQRKSSVRNLI